MRQRFPRISALGSTAFSVFRALPLAAIGVSPSYANPTHTTMENMTKKNLKKQQSWSTSDPKSAVKILGDEVGQLEKFKGNLNSTNATIKAEAIKQLQKLNKHAKAHLSYAQQYRLSLEAAREGKKTEYVTSDSLTKLLEKKKNQLLKMEDKLKTSYEENLRTKKPKPTLSTLSTANITSGYIDVE